MCLRHGEQNGVVLALRAPLQHAERAAGVERRAGYQFQQHRLAHVV